MSEANLAVCKELVNLIQNPNAARCMQMKINSTFCRWLCETASEIFKEEPNVLKVSGKAVIVGDIHGQLDDLIRILKATFPLKETSFIFLGDYVDRGKNSVEVISLLFSLKVLYPQRFFILRGNHESRVTTMKQGFMAECRSKMNKKVYDYFVECFDKIPICAVLNDQVFCVHGGLSPYAESISSIDEIDRFCEIPESGIFMDLTWADPAVIDEDFSKSPRGETFIFGKSAVAKFLEKNNLKQVIRAHEMIPEGFEKPYGDDSLITIFSNENYSGSGNRAAYIIHDGESKIITLPKFLKK
ncbi:Ser/Thr protein phosphatase, putative [Trichomonas vaginalis G3]|uniref:Serine/threonine-protein phosphatase n=1 Tax=Trichomonas vaginalis (strain ATCC PRA-98 / G3) TaxID=412133 RepID=A2DEX3_TRIV3|nr:serine threonine-protein phosphatase family [Trichomonas vaginalis G3]EAY20965.1 Ser/Thr protein phosphatase, putative [Trichomonas vaginalis G3]KAI5519125.1 serine threonine-protein phosphatase family [Trichomonas vaginalis G3]|eukprot:XP_001581951.1 Ser/Thr protein phosphatase [Trichomonas vaginalis G3]